MLRTLAGDQERFEKTYFEHFKGYYFTGDGCKRDKDGYYWLTGIFTCGSCASFAAGMDAMAWCFGSMQIYHNCLALL